MKYLLPLAICFLLASATPTPAQAQGDDYASDTGYSQQDDAAAVEGDPGTDDVAGDTAAEEPPKTDREQLRSLAEDYKEQLAEEMPSTEEMKALADKYDIKPPSANDVRDFATQHQGKFNKALDYAKQFQEFRREQAQENDSGALAPAEE